MPKRIQHDSHPGWSPQSLATPTYGERFEALDGRNLLIFFSKHIQERNEHWFVLYSWRIFVHEARKYSLVGLTRWSPWPRACAWDSPLTSYLSTPSTYGRQTETSSTHELPRITTRPSCSQRPLLSLPGRLFLSHIILVHLPRAADHRLQDLMPLHLLLHHPFLPPSRPLSLSDYGGFSLPPTRSQISVFRYGVSTKEDPIWISSVHLRRRERWKWWKRRYVHNPSLRELAHGNDTCARDLHLGGSDILLS